MWVSASRNALTPFIFLCCQTDLKTQTRTFQFLSQNTIFKFLSLNGINTLSQWSPWFWLSLVYFLQQHYTVETLNLWVVLIYEKSLQPRTCLGTCYSLNGIPFSTLWTVPEAPNPTQLDSVKYFLLMIQVVRAIWGFKTSPFECSSSYVFPRECEVLKVRRILLVWQSAWNTTDEQRAAENHQGRFRYMHNVLLVSFNEQKSTIWVQTIEM